LRIAARGALAHAHYTTGDFRGAFEAGRQALDEIPPGRGGRLEAELLISYLLAGRASPELVVDVRRRLGDPRLADGATTPAELVRLYVAGLDAFMCGRRGEARRLAQQVDGALRDSAMLANVPVLLPAGLGFVLAGIGEYEGAGTAFERCLDHAHTRGSPLETAEALESRVSARWWHGDVLGCLADVEMILSLVGEDPDLAKVPFRMCQSTVLLERGDLDGAAAALALTPELERQLHGTWAWISLPFGLARLALARREWDLAYRAAADTGKRMAAIDITSPEFFPWRTIAARALAGGGAVEQAASLAREELELAREIGSPRAIGTTLMTLGAIEADRALLDEAVAELDRAGAMLERARARLELGVLLRRERRPRDAREPLRAALDIARVAGSIVLTERARSELSAAGARPRRERTTGPDALTPRERQVAELAATGLSNPAIAERLFVTRKTVEAHLRTIFRKLDVSTRGEVANAVSPDA
jgi:DNA-binding CsgD family transcriptional regulator